MKNQAFERTSKTSFFNRRASSSKKPNPNNSDYKRKPSGIRLHFLRFVSVLIIFSFLANSTPAATETIAVSIGEIHQDIRFSMASSHLGANIGTLTNNFLLFFFGGKKKADVQKVEILPGDVRVQQGEIVDFSAIAYDYEDTPVSGVKFRWLVENTGGKVSIFSSIRNGRFKPVSPGEYKITATTEDGIQGETKVTVEHNTALLKLKTLKKDEAKGNRSESDRLKREGKYTTEEIDTKKIYQPKKDDKSEDKSEETSDNGNTIFDSMLGWLFGTDKPHGPNAEGAEYGNSRVSSAAKTASRVVRPPDEIGWDNTNWWMADDPDNQTGNPPGNSPDAGAGNGNFQFSAPVVALPGRGIDVNLSLYYNSRLWSKTGTKMSYDSDKGFPAPGWSLGFGKLMFMGTSGGCMMVDAEGTRHGYTGSVSNYSYGSNSSTSFTGNSTDGTFINYNCYYSSNSTSNSLSGQAKLSNGTIIDYGSPTTKADQAYPTRITDA
ncbi:MAG: hypothetical protein ACR2MD_15605 [Aridibacter sp.]